MKSSVFLIALIGLSLSPLTTFADETIYLDASSGAVTIAGGATDGLTRYLDFGGEDIYTIPADLAGEAEVVDNQASTIILPAGLSIADTQFSSDGVYLRANGQGVTLLGQPAAFDFVFAGNADDPSLGVLRTFAKTAELFGATIPAAGASPVNGTVSGTINTDGEITSVSDDGGYVAGTPAPTSVSTLSAEVNVAPGSAVAVNLGDGTRVDLPATNAEFVTKVERTSNTLPSGDYFPSGSNMLVSGAMRTVEFSGSGDASALKPVITIPRDEIGTLDPETVFVLRQATTMVGGEWVDGHFSVLDADFDAAGNLHFVDPMVPDSLESVLINPGDDDGTTPPGPALLYAAGASNGTYWIGNVKYSVMSFEQSLNWSESPELVRMIPDATLADHGYRREASESDLRILRRQPICNVVLLVHGHNEDEKSGFVDGTEPAPWRVGYKRRVWDLLYKTFGSGGCTAYYEFIYPSYRPIFSPVPDKSFTYHKTLGESLGELFNRELRENSQLAAMLASDIPFNLTIVAHSMGGLVARAGLRHMSDAVLDHFQRLVTWGSPHHGAGLPSLLYAMRAGHDLIWMGSRIPLHNIGQWDSYGKELDGIAIDTPGQRDLRWSAGHKSMMALGSVMQENTTTGFEKSEIELPNGSLFYSTNLQLFNEGAGWQQGKTDGKFTFFYGVTSKKAVPEENSTLSDWLWNQAPTLSFGLSTPIEQGAYLNSIAMQSTYTQSDGAVPAWSAQGAGLYEPSGIKRVNVGDVDHEEFYGAEPAQRTEETIQIGESVARSTLIEAGFMDCPRLSAGVDFSSGNLEVSGNLDYPALKLANGGDGWIGARVSSLELRKDRADGEAVNGLVSQISDESDNGSVLLTGPATAVSNITTAYLVAVLRDGSEVVSSPLTGFQGSTDGERFTFSQDYRYSGSSGWPDGPLVNDELFVSLEGDLRVNISYDGEPLRKVQIKEPVFSVDENRSPIRPTLVWELSIPWSDASSIDVSISGNLSIRPSLDSGTTERDGLTLDWGLSSSGPPNWRLSPTEEFDDPDSCDHYGEQDQLTISEDGSASLSVTVSDLATACDLVLQSTVAPYDSYVEAWGGYHQYVPVYPEIIIRITGYN
ncbi:MULTISPECIES: PGAP1-like alpha/beta domain-containing protein [Thiorhodovibrio]|uniref:PGAP1-like alpha/beta domain-containing protein n=1 Tax=Thiorhodovibrio TaxID=61593 RepID=UPI001913C35E|nr:MULTISPECIES: hypothetical protein [Thiorhodovibrio]MBK5970343.1 hypothetical protein [Thiorhodovibrio winogradskyi]WPL13699.1 PGAP1-like protein [Thiorhodovibrio litoralis]